MLFDTVKDLECLVCMVRYSRQDVIDGRYTVETMVCSYCYASMQRAPYDVSCFGKPSFVVSYNKTLLGYDPEAEECRSICPDRSVCRRVVTGR